MKLPLTGGCQCRNIRYEVRSEPMAMWACHCTECQRQTGGAFALSMMMSRADVVVTAGAPKEWLRTADSGRTMVCVYCPDCGNRLWHNPTANAAIAILKPGTLDDTSWLVPIGHIWTRSAQPWFQIPADTVNYEQQHTDPSHLIAAWKERRQPSC
jgi:hypothetical protein